MYLQDESLRLDFDNGRKVNIYGAPRTQQYGNWAFQYPPVRDVWTGIVPKDTNILLTHGPPLGYLDAERLGNDYLLQELRRVKPQLVVFGHIHPGYGETSVVFDGSQNAYDDVMLRKGGITALLRLVAHLIVSHVTQLYHKGFIHDTKLVNASIMVARHEQGRSPVTVLL